MRGKRRGERREAPSPVTTATDAGPSPGQSDPSDWPSVLPRPGPHPPPPRGAPTGAPRPSDPTRQRGAARSALAHNSLPLPAAAATAGGLQRAPHRRLGHQAGRKDPCGQLGFPPSPSFCRTRPAGETGTPWEPFRRPIGGKGTPIAIPQPNPAFGGPKIPSVGELTFPHAYLWRMGGELLWVRPWRTLGFASSGAGLAPLL